MPNTNFGEFYVSSMGRLNSSSGNKAANAPYVAYANYSSLPSQPIGPNIRRGLGKSDTLSNCSVSSGIKVKYNLLICIFDSSIIH